MKKRILIVDDDEELCREMAFILEDEGYTTAVAFNGWQGLELSGKNKYDLYLLDVKMPGINGLELLKRIKGNNVGTKALIITGSLSIHELTGKTVDNDCEAELQLADGLISKPFDVEAVLNKIKTLLR